MDNSIQSDTVRDLESREIHASKGIRLSLRQRIEQSQEIVPEKAWEKELNRKRKTRSNKTSTVSPVTRRTRSGRTYAAVETTNSSILIRDERENTEVVENSSSDKDQSEISSTVSPAKRTRSGRSRGEKRQEGEKSKDSKPTEDNPEPDENYASPQPEPSVSVVPPEPVTSVPDQALLIPDEHRDTGDKEAPSPDKDDSEVHSNQMDTASQKSYAIISRDLQDIEIESRSVILSQTTREVQQRTVSLNIDLGPSQVLEPETVESFQSDQNYVKKVSTEDEATIVDMEETIIDIDETNSQLGSDLDASFLSCALTPAPSSIVSNNVQSPAQVTVTMATRSDVDNDQVITQEEVATVAQRVEPNRTVEHKRTVQAQVCQCVRPVSRLNLADFAILESGHFESPTETNYNERKILGADFLKSIKNDSAFMKSSLPRAPRPESNVSVNSTSRTQSNSATSAVRNTSPPRRDPSPDRQSDLESNVSLQSFASSLGPSASQRNAQPPVQRPINAANRSMARPNGRNWWTKDEEQLLLRAWKKYGRKGSLIKNKYFADNPNRSAQNIRDKMKNMLKHDPTLHNLS